MTIKEVNDSMNKLSFKEASNIIGSSLIDDFSEIDSTEGHGIDYGHDVRKEASLLQRDIKSPFLEPIAHGKEYTLVLDLDETLIHFEEQEERVSVRPYAEKFLL